MRPRRRSASSPTGTRIAFAVIVAFVLAQAVWWVIFQRGYIQRVSDERLASWRSDAQLATRLLEASDFDPDTREALLSEHPHLAFEGGAFTVDGAAREDFLARQRGYQRMLAFEGPFFVLVIVGLLTFIGRSLAAERDLKKRQQNFVSAVTHEFKTPLSTLRLLVQTVQLRDLAPERQRDYLARMAGEVDRLERTSERVLAAARLEADTAPPQLQPAELNETVARTLDGLRGGLEARGAELRLHESEEPLPVSLDENAFALVLANLLDNAVKYAPEGRDARVDVTLERSGDLVHLHVDDRGPGVPASERTRVFERFYRSGDEMTRANEGVGLGLHLVRAGVEGMNGWVRIDEAPGGGARFTVVLPRRVAEARDGTAPRAAGAS